MIVKTWSSQPIPQSVFGSLYLCGLRECILCAFGDGAEVSPVDNSQDTHRRNDQEYKARKAGRHIELEDERNRKGNDRENNEWYSLVKYRR